MVCNEAKPMKLTFVLETLFDVISGQHLDTWLQLAEHLYIIWGQPSLGELLGYFGHAIFLSVYFFTQKPNYLNCGK